MRTVRIPFRNTHPHVWHPDPYLEHKVLVTERQHRHNLIVRYIYDPKLFQAREVFVNLLSRKPEK